MSLVSTHQRRQSRGFPRVSGDEPPGGEVLSVDEMFSPRERG